MTNEKNNNLISVKTITKDLISLGITEGMSLIVHSSFKSLGGWVIGGPVSVILALENVLGNSGTLVMPTHTGELSDPSGWNSPPVKESLWETIRQGMPAFDVDLIPTMGMGIIPESFRKQKGVLRSNHPQVSFASRGANADKITSNHNLHYGLGDNSPLARLYDLDGFILLLGVGNDKNTSLHLAEYRANHPNKKEIKNRAPMIVNDCRAWVEFDDIKIDSSDFERLGNDFEKDTDFVRKGTVANSTAMLIPQKELVDYAEKWFKNNRNLN
jgi:aminoglycoside 3-N-acetyltransferase